MLGSSRRQRDSVNIWPGFVDALATILLAFVFVLLLFVVAQLYLSSQLSDRNAALDALQSELEDMADALALERDERSRLEEEVSGLYAELSATLAQRDEARESLAVTESALAAAREQVATGEDQLRASLVEIATLQQQIASLRAARDDLAAEVEAADRRARVAEEAAETREMRIRDLVAEIEERQQALREERQLTADAEARVEALRRQVRALREQMSALAEALRVEEATVAEQQTRIDTLVERLNVALAEEVQELSSYRSEFFGRLREVLGDIEAIEIVGDRFRFQSELFFETASAEIGPEGRDRLAQVAETLRRVAERIPDDIDWVLQVEGHTDRRPINTPQFPSNWQLSTARAQSILDFLIDQGIPPQRLAAVGYGQYQPLVEGDSPEALAQNRRIELRLSNR
jgi:chemotaxis protein MotB